MSMNVFLNVKRNETTTEISIDGENVENFLEEVCNLPDDKLED